MQNKMGVDVVIGGQGGDEGKGSICAYLALNGDYKAAVRVPSPQAGHSVYIEEKRVGLAILPCGVVNPTLRCLIGTGGLISVERLLDGFEKPMRDGTKKFIPPEIPETKITPARLGIDYNATVVTPEHKRKENENSHLMGKIGSVGEGVGMCRLEKIMRSHDLVFAKDIPKLQVYLTDTKKEIYDILKNSERVLLEGDHGAKLDLIHGDYPYVTSRATNAAGFLSEAGIGPMDVDDIYVVLKPYTTRVASGPMESEISDENVLRWAEKIGGETGTVSGRKRRIGRFEWENVSEVIRMNSATKIAITHMDSPDFVWDALGYDNPSCFLDDLENNLCRDYPYPTIFLLSYGPKVRDIIEY